MDPANILPLLGRLDDSVDNLDDALEPLVNNSADLATKVPLLDKAKLYLLMAYAIESTLFCSLRLNGDDVKEHPISKELARVRQSFEKIKKIEFPPQKPQQSLNKAAAISFIRADLADNKEVNTKLSEMIAKERAMAALKAKMGAKRKLDVATAEEKSSEDITSKDSDQSEDESGDEAEPQVEQQPKKKVKKAKKDKSERKEKKEKHDKKDKKDKRKRGKKSKKSSES
ncbi:Sas10/Utp3/C1D family-domain-containing protein [Astrocystis sublimbata]|nr:Sas10/Utp3/C1D family-domain-containing protein [Astrocystis sublimbata]